MDFTSATEHLTNYEMVGRQLEQFVNTIEHVKQVCEDYKHGLITELETATLLEDAARMANKTATLYKIAELAYQLEVKYGKE